MGDDPKFNMSTPQRHVHGVNCLDDMT